MSVTDRVDNLLASVEHHLEAAHTQIERGGSVADAGLLCAISVLTEAVKELAKRNDPLGAEKVEHEWRKTLGENPS